MSRSLSSQATCLAALDLGAETGVDHGAAAWVGFLAGLELSQAAITNKISAKKEGGIFFKALIFNFLNPSDSGNQANYFTQRRDDFSNTMNVAALPEIILRRNLMLPPNYLALTIDVLPFPTQNTKRETLTERCRRLKCRRYHNLPIWVDVSP